MIIFPAAKFFLPILDCDKPAYKLRHAVACVDNQQMRTVAIGGRKVQASLEYHWLECIPSVDDLSIFFYKKHDL